MGAREVERGAVGVVQRALHGLLGRQIGQAPHRQAVVDPDLVVRRRVGEPERQDALLLEVGLGDAGEAAGEDRHAAHEPRLHRGVLA